MNCKSEEHSANSAHDSGSNLHHAIKDETQEDSDEDREDEWGESTQKWKILSLLGERGQHTEHQEKEHGDTKTCNASGCENGDLKEFATLERHHKAEKNCKGTQDLRASDEEWSEFSYREYRASIGVGSGNNRGARIIACYLEASKSNRVINFVAIKIDAQLVVN